jgi:hypothetical protein
MEPGRVTETVQPCYAEITQNAIQDDLENAFQTFKGSVLQGISGRLRLLNSIADGPPPPSQQQRSHLRRWIAEYQMSQDTARRALNVWQHGYNDPRMANFDKLQLEARGYTSQGQEFARNAALCYAHAHELEKKARSMFAAELSGKEKGGDLQMDSKAATRHARDLAIHAIASIVLPQNENGFAQECANVLEEVAPVMSHDFWSQLKNGSKNIVVFADSNQIRAERSTARKVDCAPERGRSRGATRSLTLPRDDNTYSTQVEMDVWQEIAKILSTKSADFLQRLLLQLTDNDPVAIFPLTRANSQSVERTVGHLCTRGSSVDVLPMKISVGEPGMYQ